MKQLWKRFYQIGVTALIVAAIAILGRFSANAQLTAIVPIATGVTVANSVTQIVGANPTRRALLVCNVGATNDVWLAPIAPAGQAQITPAALGAGSVLLSRTSAAGANVTVNCLNIPGASVPTGSAPIPGLVTAGFNGITNAATSPVTVWEF